MSVRGKNLWIFAALIFMFLFLGCTGLSMSQGEMDEKAAESEGMTKEKTDSVDLPGDWKNIELIDVATGKKFKVNDFQGKPVLLESFAVWCPTCLQQQKQMKELIRTEGEAVVHISLDTDPNEDESQVKNHIEQNEFDWYFAVSPIELTQSLIDEFGITIVNAPGAPVILICPDQSSRLLGRGVKSPEQLKSEIEKGC